MQKVPYLLFTTLLVKSSLKVKGKANDRKTFNSKKYPNNDAILSNLDFKFSQRSTVSSSSKEREDKVSFVAEPESIVFNAYQVGNIYETTVKIRNVSQTARSIRVLPPKTSYFSINEGKFPLPGSSVIAPGMAAIFMLRFSPDNLGDFDDEFIVKYENQLEPLNVKLLGRKSRPRLNIHECYDLGSTLKGSTKVNHIQIENYNPESVSSGEFLFITKELFDQCSVFDAKKFAEYNTLCETNDSSRLCLESFSIEPVRFTLEALKSVTIRIEFKPLHLGEYQWELVLICDNGQFFPVLFKGFSEELKLEMMDTTNENVSSSLRKIACDSKELFYFYQFPIQYPFTVAPKTIRISNFCSQSLRFQWVQQNPNNQIYCTEYTSDSLIKSDDMLNQRRSLTTSLTTTPDVQNNENLPLLFTIHPTTGVFEANETKSFEIRFNPTEIGTFRSQLEMILLNIPEVDENNACYTLDKKHLTIELKGIAESLPISIEPSILIIPGKCLLDVPLHQNIQLVNKSHNCPVAFYWKADFNCKADSISSNDDGLSQSTADMRQLNLSKHLSRSSDIEEAMDNLIIIEPTMGVIAPGQSINIDIILSSSKSLTIKEDIPCFIDILPNSPLWLHIEAEFTEPAIVFDKPDCNFGLMRPNETVKQNIQLTNTSPSPRKWRLEMDTVNSKEPAIVFDKPDCNFGLMRPNETVKQNIQLTNTSPSPRKWRLEMDTVNSKSASEMKIHPSCGILKPVQSVTVNLSFTPEMARSVREVITVRTEESEEISKLLILAEVQAPLIDFEPNHIDYNECYWNIPITKIITVTNLNLLECDLEWIDPVGKDKEWVTVNVTPKSFRISGHQNQKCEVTLCAHKQAPVKDLRIPLRVDGLNDFLWLSITARVNGLSLKYHLINSDDKADESEVNSQEYFTVMSDINSKILVINFGENVGLFEPVEKWIEFKNDTPIPTRICIDMGNLSTKVNYADYNYKPELGAKRFLKLTNQTTDSSLSRRKLLLLMAEKECRTEIRNLYDWCNSILKGSKGACVLAHSAISSSSSDQASDFQLAKHHLVTINTCQSETLIMPSWCLPSYGYLRICFICIANLWGAYQDSIRVYVFPEFNIPSEVSLPHIKMPVRFKVIGCPVYSIATGHFGQLSNTVLTSMHHNKLGSNDILPKTALPLTATRQYIRFGSVLYNGPIVKRKIRLHNSCGTAIRIDWQVFLDSEIEETDQLLNLLCFISEPFHKLPSSSLIDDKSLESTETIEDGSSTKPLINLVLRPYDGKLIWQSSSAQILPALKDDYKRLFTVEPEQVIIPPHEEFTVTIVMNAAEAYSEMMSYSMFNLKAHITGYLSIDSKEFLDIPRTNALITEQLRFDVTAKLEQPRLLIDLNDDPLEIDNTHASLPSSQPITLHFKSGFGQFLSVSSAMKNMQNNLNSKHNTPSSHSILTKHDVEQPLQRSLTPSDYEAENLLMSSIVLERKIYLRCTNSIPVAICIKAKYPENLRFRRRTDGIKEATVNSGEDNLTAIEDHDVIVNTNEYSNETTITKMNKADFEEFYKPQINLTVHPDKLEKITVGYLLEKDFCLRQINSKASQDNLEIDESHLRLKNEILFKFQVTSVEINNVTLVDSMINNSTDIYQLHTQITIIRPQFKIHPIGALDFGTVLIGKTKKMEIKIQNLTQTPTFWLLKLSNDKKPDEIDARGDIFRTTKCSGYLNSMSNDGSQFSELITVEFQPRKTGCVETTWKFEGILGERTQLIKLIGAGSLDECFNTI
ncbi:unnamed protein product [Trichobilharzia szidati]|nr:unnamed protein product [Trichobilharzia szidati]